MNSPKKSRSGSIEAKKGKVEETVSLEERAAMESYRQSLIEAEKKGQDSFDKTVLSLAGGALGISFLFIKDVIGENPISHPALLLFAWLSWAASTLAVLSSFFTSNLALRRAVQQCDKGTIHCEPPGGIYSKMTRVCNLSGIVLLIAGILFMAAFVYKNLLDRGTTDGDQTHKPNAAPNSRPYSSPEAAGKSEPRERLRATSTATNEEAVKK